MKNLSNYLINWVRNALLLKMVGDSKITRIDDMMMHTTTKLMKWVLLFRLEQNRRNLLVFTKMKKLLYCMRP